MGVKCSNGLGNNIDIRLDRFPGEREGMIIYVLYIARGQIPPSPLSPQMHLWCVCNYVQKYVCTDRRMYVCMYAFMFVCIILML